MSDDYDYDYVQWNMEYGTCVFASFLLFFSRGVSGGVSLMKTIKPFDTRSTPS